MGKIGTSTKTLLILTSALCAAPCVFCQEAAKSVCMSVDEAKNTGTDISKLRETYIPAFSSGPEAHAFPGKSEEVHQAWVDLQETITAQLEKELKSDLVGQKIFSIYFFGKDGKIDYFVHRCSDEAMSAAICPIIEKLAEDYRFPLESEIPFSQCGSYGIYASESKK